MKDTIDLEPSDQQIIDTIDKMIASTDSDNLDQAKILRRIKYKFQDGEMTKKETHNALVGGNFKA
jgi:hypothetical protein